MKQAELNGQLFEFPDEATDEDIDAAVGDYATSSIPSYDSALDDNESWATQMEGYLSAGQSDTPRNQFDYNAFVDSLAGFEGVDTHTAFESGKRVRGYGVEVIPPGVIDSGDDRQLAYDTAQWHVGQMAGHLNSKYGVKFDQLPSSVQSMMADLRYNTGRQFKDIDESIGNGDYLRAAYQSLNVVGSTVKGEQATIGGLARRRASRFNEVANSLGAEPINQVVVQDLGEQGTSYTYVGASGSAIASFTTKRKLRGTQTDSNGVRVFTL